MNFGWRLRCLSIECFLILLVTIALPRELFAKAAIEIVPLAVWQGKPTRPWSVGMLRDLRRKFPALKMAHAISPAPLVRGGDNDLGFRLKFARIVQPGDDVLLHFAPWRSLVQKAKLNFRSEPTVFGAPLNIEGCSLDCGLDLSVTAFDYAELKQMANQAKATLYSRGFGEVQAVFFDQGVVPGSLRKAFSDSDIPEDWSAVELSQLKGNMRRFPVYGWNVENAAKFRADDLSVSVDGGFNVDHLRFAIQAEIADVESASRIINTALDVAENSNRTVRIPIVFNVEDLIHTQNFVEEAIQKVTSAVSQRPLAIKEWSAKNSKWDADAIRRGEAPSKLLASDVRKSAEAEFVSDDERILSIEMAH